MFERMDIRLTEPLCEHIPKADQETWRWYATDRCVDGRYRTSLHLYSVICGKRMDVPPERTTTHILINGLPARLHGKLISAEASGNGEKYGAPPKAIVHERNFTEFDREICKRLGIRFEGE